MKTFLEFYQLDEKQIQYGKNANYGQIVFFAGGAASGKGFSISNFIDATKFKIRDVDQLKTQMMRMDSLLKKYPDLSNLKLSNPQDVFRLHQIAKAERLPEKQMTTLIGGQKSPETLPNILFDTTLKDLDDIDTYMPQFLKIGYKPENVHITWVLTDYSVAIIRNKQRERIVPDDIMLKTHTGAALTIAHLLKSGLPKSVNGSFTIILNNPEEVTFYEKTGAEGKTISTKVVKDFTYLTLKQQGRSMPSMIEMESAIREKLFQWVVQNAPKIDAIQRAYEN